jgi:stage II sporulation protein AB (anti-sigma F factor)
MKEDYMKLIVKSKSENESFVRATVAAFASRMNPTLEEVSDIQTAVSEAVTNCIVHGYKDSKGEIEIITLIYEDTLTIKINDLGKGIENIEEARKPFFSSVPQEERSGMGFTIMETFMDKVEVISQIDVGTRVTLTKQIMQEETVEP